jgi:septation ring formation regulator EzrA
MIDYVNIIISLGTLIGSGLICWGVMSTKVEYLEETIKELKQEVKDFRRLGEDLAVVKSKLSTIEALLERFVVSKERGE